MKARTRLNLILIALLLIFFGVNWLFTSNRIRKHTYETHTIKIGERDVKKLITATQFVDFVTVLVSGDRNNEYIEYQTYKVEAGFDLNEDKNTVRIINKPNELDRTVVRNKVDAGKYDAFIKPIRSAYAIKSCDIAVEYKVLENAKKNISELDQKLFGINPASVNPALSQNTNVKYLPCNFQTFGDTLNNDVKASLLNHLDFEFSSQNEEFSRDAMIVGIKGKTKDTYIQIGYTGRKFESDTFASFKERLQTENENITLFTYFDPLDDENSKQVLSYATDNYRTAFVLHGGKLYYINLHASDAQTRENLGYLVLYLAMSIRFDDGKADISKEYMRYLEDYDSALTYLRNKKYPELKVTVDDMLKQKKNKTAETEDERMLYDATYYFRRLEYENLPVNNDFDSLMSNCTFLYDSHEKQGDFKDKDKRDALLKEISSSIKKNEHEVRANVLTYFLQNETDFDLTEAEKKNYLNELIQRAVTVDRTILETFDTDRERNKFYTDLFKNAAEKNKVEEFISEAHPDMTFFFMGDTRDNVGGTGRLEKKLVERNGGIPLGNAFVLVFADSDFPILSSMKTDDKQGIIKKIKEKVKDFVKTADDLSKTVHVLVFDDCSVRLFACVDDDSIFETAVSIVSNIVKFATQKRTAKIDNFTAPVPEFVYFWDWRKMNIYKNETAFLGYDFSNTANYGKAKKTFSQTERGAEVRSVGEILLQLQHAYENDNFHYELALDFVERQMRNYIYETLWRPSLRISEAEQENLGQYNYIWSDN